MKVLSLLQPWATLVVIGAKKIETRSWNTRHRGPLLIHASQGKSKDGRQLANTDPFKLYLPTRGPLNGFNTCLVDFDALPFGSIIGQVDLVETFQFGSDRSIEYVQGLSKPAAQQEIAFGDWREGRWGFRLENHKLFEHPIPCKGALFLWEYDLEEENKQLIVGGH